VRGCSVLFLPANDEFFRRGHRFGAGFVGGEIGYRRGNFVHSHQIPHAEEISEIESVVEEKEGSSEEIAIAGKEKERERIAQPVTEKEIENIPDAITEEGGIADPGGVSTAADNGQDARWPHRRDACATIANATRCGDAGSHCSASDCSWPNSASRR
jgi:hypothetical protein